MVPIFTVIYDRVLEWSRHRHAERYLFGMSMAESVIFPIPPDVMLAPMVLARRDRAWWLATLTTVASVIGGLIGYGLGFLAFEAIEPWIERAGWGDAYLQAVDAFQTYGLGFVILAGFSPIPFKLVTIAAGVLGMPLIGFVGGCVIGRGARFFMVAGIIYAGGRRAAEHLRSYVDRIGWTVVVLVVALAVLWLTGCAPTMPATVVDKSGVRIQSHYVAPASYEVREGDSLYSIAFRYGLDWRDVARWNQLAEPYTIVPGERVRLRQPVGMPRGSVAGVATTSGSREARVETAPLSPRPVTQASPLAREVPIVTEKPVAPWIEPTSTSATAERRMVEGVSWQWPLSGPVARAFDPKATRRGLGIQGQRGGVVVAAGDGEVVYSGRALIGYGELIIIKHSDTLLSAYGYNQKRLVDEGVRVRAGAPIAEVGQTTDGDWMLHFEIRRNGQTIDPRLFLPKTIQ